MCNRVRAVLYLGALVASIESVGLSSASAEETPPRPFILTALYTATAGLQAFDTGLTLSVVGSSATEKNPAMKGLVQHPPAFIALKAGVTASSILVAERLWKSDRRIAAIAVMAVSTGVMATVATRNVATLR